MNAVLRAVVLDALSVARPSVRAVEAMAKLKKLIGINGTVNSIFKRCRRLARDNENEEKTENCKRK